MTNNNINFKQVDDAADRISLVMKTIDLQTNLIDFAPRLNGLSHDDLLVNYSYLDKALGNMHELNQGLSRELDKVLCLLQEIAEELEAEPDEPN